MKKWIALLAVLLFLCPVCAPAEEPVRVAALKGPTAMGMVSMMEKENYAFTVAGAVDEITPLLLRGEVDIAAIPANLAANLYNKTEGGVRVLAVNTLGVLYLVENGNAVSSVQDLRGRTVYASGKGATPEYALNYVLRENGLENDVNVEYLSEHTECLAALLSHEGSVAMLPQPFVTTARMKQSDVRVALDLNVEWARLQDGREEKSALLTGVTVARTAFLEEYPDLAAAFLADYAESAAFTNERTGEAAALMEKYDIIPENVAREAIPECRVVCVTGAEMKEALSGYLKVLFDQNPAAVGGKLPEENFYYEP